MWVKPLNVPLDENAISRILRLNHFHVTVEEVVFRTAHYHKVSAHHLIMDTIPGKTARSLIFPSGRWGASASSRQIAGNTATLAGRWLAHFHRWPSDGPVEAYDAAARMEKAAFRIEVLSRRGLPAKTAGRLLATLNKAVTHDPPSAVVTIHGDFKPANLMLAGNEVVGIDLEAYQRGRPLVDLGQFIAHLFLSRSAAWVGTGSPHWWRCLAEAFLEGYRRDADWNMAGLQPRVLDAVLNAVTRMSERHNGTFWAVRGAGLMTRTFEYLLDNPLTKAQP